MKTQKYYIFRTNDERPNHVILNGFSIGRGYTDSMDIYASDSHDFSYTDSEGNRVTIGKRLTKDRKSRVQITIINSYQKHVKDKEQKLLTINND